jgi:hypothetical protein
VAWERTDKLLVAGLIIAVLGIVIGAVATILPSEVGCFTHLGACPADTSAAHAPSAGGLSPMSATPPGILAAPADGNLPFTVHAPSSSGSSTHPAIALSSYSIINRGTFAIIKIAGSGFTPNNSATISWNDPEGGTYVGTTDPVTNGGTFEQALFWFPQRGNGIAGNDGEWPISVKDTATGKTVSAQLDVSSNAQTPPPNQWPSSYNLPPSGAATVHVKTYGTLCRDPYVLVQVDLSGFAPNGQLTVYYLRPDGESVMSQGEIADGLGQVTAIQSYWAIQACKPGEDFHYTVLVSDNQTDRAARTPLIFSAG